jgi:hypothetical protein
LEESRGGGADWSHAVVTFRAKGKPMLSISNGFVNSFGILIFFRKNLKTPLHQFDIFGFLTKERAVRVYMRTSGSHASLGIGLSREAFRCLADLFVRLASLFVS